MSHAPSAGIAIARIVLGVIMLVHGIQKLTVFTIAGVQDMLAGLGLPLPEALGAVLPVVEIVAGVLLVLGLFTRVGAVLTVLVGLGALFTAHLESGFFVDAGGYEFVLLIAATGAALALLGGGRFALDAVLPFGRKAPVAAR